MQSHSILTSVGSEKRWVVEMIKTFPKEHVLDIDLDTPQCVFKVPKTLSETKPEAYTPRLLGLGPYHHLRPEFYMMHRKKLAAIRKKLNAELVQNLHLAVEALMQLEPILRACYDQYLDLDPMTLAWILVIDALYLTRFLRNFIKDEAALSDPEREILAGDVMMMENQIPVVLLKEIRRALGICGPGGEDFRLFADLDMFCYSESPLILCDQAVIRQDMGQYHLLHRMYHLIVNNRGLHDEKLQDNDDAALDFNHKLCEKTSIMTFYENVIKRGLQIAEEGGSKSAAVVNQHIAFLEKVPWDRILSLFKTGDPDERNPLVEEIDIPSVSQLSEIAKIEFTLTMGGIRDVKFDEGERKFYLPVIKLSSNSEIILRNLVAYEAASAEPGSPLELAEYVDLMCGIVDTPKDVELLKNKKIIQSDLPAEEIACIFNGIRKSTGKMEKATSNIEKAIDSVNERYDDLLRIKAVRFMKKHVYTSWKFLTFLSTVMVLLLMTVQAFCQVYSCGRRWFP